MEKLTFNNEQLEFLKFIVQDFEYNDDHERYMIEQIENKIYQAQENQALKLLSRSITMKSTLNSKEYVTFARRFVKETVATMDIEELRSIVSDRIHEEIQEQENTFGQEGAFEEMIAWSEDVFLEVAKDFELEFEGV